MKPALNYFFPTDGFARNVPQLDNTDFHGLNPKILKPGLKKKAYKTKLPTEASQHCKEQVQQYRGELQKIKQPLPHYMAHTESSEAKRQAKYAPLQTTPKP